MAAVVEREESGHQSANGSRGTVDDVLILRSSLITLHNIIEDCTAIASFNDNHRTALRNFLPIILGHYNEKDLLGIYMDVESYIEEASQESISGIAEESLTYKQWQREYLNEKRDLIKLVLDGYNQS